MCSRFCRHRIEGENSYVDALSKDSPVLEAIVVQPYISLLTAGKPRSDADFNISHLARTRTVILLAFLWHTGIPATSTPISVICRSTRKTSTCSMESRLPVARSPTTGTMSDELQNMTNGPLNVARKGASHLDPGDESLFFENFREVLSSLSATSP